MYVDIYMYVCIYVCMWIYIYMYVCMYICMYTCMYVDIYVCTCICMYVYVCIMYMYVHVYSMCRPIHIGVWAGGLGGGCSPPAFGQLSFLGSGGPFFGQQQWWEGGCFSIFRRADDVTRTMSKGGGCL